MLNKMYKIIDVEKVRCPMVDRACAGEWCPAYQLIHTREQKEQIEKDARARQKAGDDYLNATSELVRFTPRQHFQCGMTHALADLVRAVDHIELNVD